MTLPQLVNNSNAAALVTASGNGGICCRFSGSGSGFVVGDALSLFDIEQRDGR
ncbi:hypothetical protein [Streptomyces nigra]|uniref:hypothetical protein n=1 Tax=Streptomyces nigra TaxID=1827580 RepID=UPI00342CA253